MLLNGRVRPFERVHACLLQAPIPGADASDVGDINGLQPRQSAASAGLAGRHPELVPHEPPAAAVQDGWTSHPARPVLHPATRRKLLDTAPVPADRGAHRAPRVAPDVIERTAPIGSKLGDAGRSVSGARRQRRETRGDRAINGAGIARTVPVTEHAWPDWGHGASRGSLSSTRGERT
jgi:hypothetical protein